MLRPMDILRRDRGQRRNGAAAEAGVCPQRGAGEDAVGQAGPPLVLLVNDASRSSAYRVHTFADAPAAARFIEFWFPAPCTRRGLLAFWVLACPPGAGGETVALIRVGAGSDLAYPFSFSNYEAGLSFLRAEIAGGLDPRLVLLHRAAPIAVECGESGEARLTPARPPVRPAPAPREQARRGFGMPRFPVRAEAFQGFGSPPGRF